MKEELFRSELIELDSDNKKWKAKCSELENKNKELLHDNQTLSKCYVSMKADKGKAKTGAKANGTSGEQAQKCIVIASESLEKEDYTEAEKIYHFLFKKKPACPLKFFTLNHLINLILFKAICSLTKEI